MTAYHKLTLDIYGAKYPIKTPEEPEYVRELAAQLDETVRGLLNQSRSMSFNEALMLAAMSYLDSYRKSENNADHLRAQIAEYLEDAAKLRQEAAEARREVAKLESRLAAKGNKNG